MRFEHLVQINDAGNPLVPTMTRAELWRGLLARAWTPERFPLGPDRCELRGGESVGLPLQRTVHFGGLALDDTVLAEPERSLRFEPAPREDMPKVVLTISIEEPAPGDLFLRFLYESPEVAANKHELDLQGLRQQAWLANDLDMVRTLRQWLDEGLL
ncbi:MAG TPA: AtaL-like protein [Methylibium sp.]